MKLRRRALNFDLDTNNLKQYYPSHCWRKAYKDIEKYLLKNGFKHQQWSGYVSVEPMSMNMVTNIIKGLSNNHPWLKYCVRQFDVTIVGQQHSLIDVFNTDKSRLEPVKSREDNRKPSFESQVSSATKKRDEQSVKRVRSHDFEQVI